LGGKVKNRSAGSRYVMRRRVDNPRDEVYHLHAVA